MLFKALSGQALARQVLARQALARQALARQRISAKSIDSVAVAVASAVAGCDNACATTTRHFSTTTSSAQTQSPQAQYIKAEVNRETKVMTVTFSSPDTLNALSIALGTEFKDIIMNPENINFNDVGAIVITGQGRAFSAGGGLDFLQARTSDTPSRNAWVLSRFYRRLLEPIRQCPVPVVAAINGPAIGAGLCAALACDMRVTHKKCDMGVTFAKLGLHPGMGSTHFLPQIVGPQRAAELLLSGRTFKGEEALKMGLVLEAVDSSEDALPRAQELAASFALNSPITVRGTMRSLRLIQDEGLERALQREADAQAQSCASSDMKEGLDAVKNKRQPKFQNFEDVKQTQGV